MYVGSSSGRPGALAQTIRRHLSGWNSNRCTLSSSRRSCPGVTLNPRSLGLAVLVLSSEKQARAVEKGLIRKLGPKLNTVVYDSKGAEVPF